VAIAGDVLVKVDYLTGRPGPREPPPFFSADPALNRQSIRLLAMLRPSIVCFGHGPPLRDPEELARFAERLV
jgi:glyoxylase-like metal-dependent hydrolase (beta-lactamase superfamily II)